MYICNLLHHVKIQPGRIQSLTILEANPHGYLLGENDQQVFLPSTETREKLNAGDEVEVFVYYSEEALPVATTRLPAIQLNQAGCFRVLSANPLGAFVNIETSRDILIPAREQKEPLNVGDFCVMVLKMDHQKNRLYGSTRITSHLRNVNIPFQRGDEVQMMIAEKLEMGRRVVVNKEFLGLLFRTEMTRNVRTGDVIKGYIRKIEGDEITVSMQKEGIELINDAAEQLLEFLKANGGYARLTDDTSPEELKLRLRMSKKTFKKAAGKLFKEQKIILTKLGIKLNRESGLTHDTTPVKRKPGPPKR